MTRQSGLGITESNVKRDNSPRGLLFVSVLSLLVPLACFVLPSYRLSQMCNATHGKKHDSKSNSLDAFTNTQLHIKCCADFYVHILLFGFWHIPRTHLPNLHQLFLLHIIPIVYACKNRSCKLAHRKSKFVINIRGSSSL